VKLAGLRLYRYELPITEPPEPRGTTLREGLLVKLAGGGDAVGWGGAAPLPGFSRESPEEVGGQLRALADAMVGREVAVHLPDPYGPLARELDMMGLAPSARFGVELALWNLYAASSGKVLPELITPLPRATVPINALISSPDHALEEARRMRAAGYEAVKLKVGIRSVEEDVELVRALSEVLGGGVSLTLDANRAWGFEEAAAFASSTANVRFEYVEEPLADPSRLPALAREYGVPVALDESLVGMTPGALEAHGYARAVVLKPTLLGFDLADAAPGEPGAKARHHAGHQLRLRDRRRHAGPPRARRRGGRSPRGPGHAPPAGDVLDPRPRLGSARIDVNAMVGTRRGMDHRWLTPVG